jgi:hypothetical protein
MTTLPDDPIDAGEARFARRVRDYTEPAVVPVDHAAVATAAAGSGGPRRSATGRLAWLFAGAAVIGGVAAVAILAGVWRGPDVGATASAPPVVSVAACTTEMLEASVGSWEGAAGHRIGTLAVRNVSGAACGLPSRIQPSLIDRNGHDLIVGKPASVAPVTIPAGGALRTLVQAGNYCGPTAQEPAAVVLAFGGQRVIARPAAGDASSGVPPCMGEAGPTDDITMQPWGAAQG